MERTFKGSAASSGSAAGCRVERGHLGLPGLLVREGVEDPLERPGHLRRAPPRGVLATPSLNIFNDCSGEMVFLEWYYRREPARGTSGVLTAPGERGRPQV